VVVVQLDTHPPGAASGFKPRADTNQPVRELDLLRDAFNHGWRVHFDHEVPAGKQKGTSVRVWVTKDAVAPTGVGTGAATGVVFGTVGTLTPVTSVSPVSPAIGLGAAPGTVIRRDTPE
jgi:hypothetical protein